MAIYCQYVLASGVSLVYHLLVVTNLLFPLCSHAFLLLVYIITHADCHMFNYCFSFHISPLCNFLPYVFSAYQHSLLAAYFSLFTPQRYCPPMLNQSITVLFLHLCTLCSLHTPCLLRAHSAMHPSCLMPSHCLLTTLCALVIHSTLVTSSSPVASASWWLYAHSLLWAHIVSLMVHPPLCIFTICTTILVWVS